MVDLSEGNSPSLEPTLQIQVERTPQGHFVKGQSGNPAGRPICARLTGRCWPAITPGREKTFEARFEHLAQHYCDGRELDTANASPAELLAAYVANVALPPTLPSPASGEGRVGIGGALG